MKIDYEAAAQTYATDADKDWDDMTEADKDFAIMSVKEYVDAALPDGDLYQLCRECEGSGWTGEDICDLCVVSNDPLGWVKVERDDE